MEKTKKKGKIGGKRKLIFYIAMMALPVLQFCIFWIGVNINSLKLAFQTFDFNTGRYVWYGFGNFKVAFENFATIPYFKTALKNSLLIYALGIGVGTPLGLLFSFYLYKKKLLHGVFRIVLFLPSIISSVVMVMMYKYFMDGAIPGIIESITGTTTPGLIANLDTQWFSVVFYGIWTSFATSTMIYSSTMSGISESVVEAAKLDGIKPLQEFWYITLPLVWPTFVTFTVTGFAGLLTNSAHLYSFFGEKAAYSLYTFGYYLYVKTKSAAAINYPSLAALGLIFTLVIAPLTVLLRWAMNKFGPRTD